MTQGQRGLVEGGLGDCSRRRATTLSTVVGESVSRTSVYRWARSQNCEKRQLSSSCPSVLMSVLFHVYTSLGPSHVAKSLVRLHDNWKTQRSLLEIFCFLGYQGNFSHFIEPKDSLRCSSLVRNREPYESNSHLPLLSSH